MGLSGLIGRGHKQLFLVAKRASNERGAGRAARRVGEQLSLTVPGRNDKNLARIDKIGITDLPTIGLVNRGVARAQTVAELADAPDTVATGARGGHDLRHDYHRA